MAHMPLCWFCCVVAHLWEFGLIGEEPAFLSKGDNHDFLFASLNEDPPKKNLLLK